MAELLSGVLLTATRLVAAPLGGSEQLEGGQLAKAAAEHLAAANSSFPLPPPMIPGNVENPTTLCAMQARIPWTTGVLRSPTAGAVCCSGCRDCASLGNGTRGCSSSGEHDSA